MQSAMFNKQLKEDVKDNKYSIEALRRMLESNRKQTDELKELINNLCNYVQKVQQRTWVEAADTGDLLDPGLEGYITETNYERIVYTEKQPNYDEIRFQGLGSDASYYLNDRPVKNPSPKLKRATSYPPLHSESVRKAIQTRKEAHDSEQSITTSSGDNHSPNTCTFKVAEESIFVGDDDRVTFNS